VRKPQRTNSYWDQFSYSRECPVCFNPLDYEVELTSYGSKIQGKSMLGIQNQAEELKLGKCTITDGYYCKGCRVVTGERVMSYNTNQSAILR